MMTSVLSGGFLRTKLRFHKYKPAFLSVYRSCSSAAAILSRHAPAPADPEGDIMTDELQGKITEMASKPVHPIRLASMYEWTQNQSHEQAVAKSALFLHEELPVRVAERIQCLDRLPCGLNLMPSVLTVRNWYVQTFKELVEARAPTNHEMVEDFTAVLGGIWRRHGRTAVNVSKGVKELEQRLQLASISNVDLPGLSEALDRFHLGRIGMRLLVGHHLLVHTPKRQGFVGMLKKDMDLLSIVHKAANDSSQICTRAYGSAPEVSIRETGKDPFLYVPDHAYYILLELCKNSMRAVMEYHGEIVGRPLPPIKIIIANGPGTEDASIKVSDEGGGISRRDMDKIWSHVFSTTTLTPDERYESGNPVNMPIAGYGQGLPSARCYARYFSGDLNVVSLEGHGTDVYVHLDKSSDQVEVDAAPPANINLENNQGGPLV